MTTTFDSISTGSQDYGLTVTQSHTVLAGSNRILTAFVGAGGADAVVGVTFNGVALTRQKASIGSAASAYLYTLLAPDVGTFNLVTTLINSTQAAVCLAGSRSGINQATPVLSTAGYFGLGTPSPYSLAIDASAGIAVDIIVGEHGTIADFVNNAAQALIGSKANPPGNTFIGFASEAAGVSSMKWSWADYRAYAHAAMVLNPVAVVDTTAPIVSSPTGAATGNTTASASVNVSEVGTVWCLTNTAATALTAAVKAGTSQAVTTPGVQTFAPRTGLTPDTLYYNHFVADDLAATPNTSTVSDSPSFRTPGKVVFSGPVPTRNGVVGTAASFANAGFFASAFTLAYTLQAGTLPAGLTLSSSTGIISGTPTTAGTSSGIVIRATDTNSNVADTNAYSIVIAATNAAPTFPGTIANITGTGGSAITPVNVSGQFSDTDTLSYTASPAGTAWPSGLIVNSSTGIISGTVATSTTAGLKVRATDTAPQTVDSNAFSLTMTAPAANKTWTTLGKLENIMGAPAVGVAVHAFVNDKLTGALIEAKTGLTTGSDGGVAPFTTTAGTAGTSAEVKIVDDANPLRRSIEIVTPT